MKNKNRGRRGMTVSELMVVLAVLTIVIVMVVSFSTMVGSTSKLAKAKLDALNDIRLAESVIEGFIVNSSNEKNVDASDALTFSNDVVINGITKYTTMRNSQGKRAEFSNGVLTCGDTTVVLENVESVHFYIIENTADTIYYCTITYLIGDSRFNYTFCVNPYAGEKIGGNS